jgi:dCMP deaminase
MTDRPSWDAYFRGLAELVAARSTCRRASVGVVVVVVDHMILATGYNGAPPGMPHCPEDEDLDPQAHCPRSIHAEQNVIGHAARRGTRLEGATWYLHPFGPCPSCALLVATTRPARIVAARDFGPSGFLAGMGGQLPTCTEAPGHMGWLNCPVHNYEISRQRRSLG